MKRMVSIADAERLIVAEWMRLPMNERRTSDQAAVFAMEATNRYEFRTGGVDPYQAINGWLQKRLPK